MWLRMEIKRPEVKLAADGSLTTGRAEIIIGKRGAGAAMKAPQTVSDYGYCKGKQIAATRVF